eukprot:jgi/Mesen1/801/ME000110S_11063
MPATIHFHLTCCDARELAKKLAERHVVLDRVDVSNACDHNYMGIAPVLQDWGPLLRRARAEEGRGVLLTTFMNWFQADPALGPDEDMAKRDMEKALRAFAASKSCKREALGIGASVEEFQRGSAMSECLKLMKRHHDYFPAFKMYLKDQGALRAARTLGLTMRKENKILPPRSCVPLGASPHALPANYPMTEEEEYLAHNLADTSFNGRVAEWVPQG